MSIDDEIDDEPATPDSQSVVKHRYRRRLLECLEGHGSLALADLADEIAVREESTTLAAISPEVVLDVYLELYHTHVPALERANLVVYDQERDTVSLPGQGDDATLEILNVDIGGTADGDESTRE